MRLATALTLALLGWAAPVVGRAQTQCAGSTAASSGYSSYVPTGYSAYSGFASFPGGLSSGTLPAGYSTNPYGGCAATSANPSDIYGGAASAPTYSAVIASNVYNPYSGWGITNAASYPYASAYANSNAYTSGLYSYSSVYPYGSANHYGGFASFPGMAPSGVLGSLVTPIGRGGAAGAASNSASTPSPFSSYPATTGAPGAASSTGQYGTGQPGTSYTPGYGATAAASPAGNPSYGTAGTTATGYGGTGYYGYGNGSGSSGSYSGVSTMITFGPQR